MIALVCGDTIWVAIGLLWLLSSFYAGIAKRGTQWEEAKIYYGISLTILFSAMIFLYFQSGNCPK